MRRIYTPNEFALLHSSPLLYRGAETRVPATNEFERFYVEFQFHHPYGDINVGDRALVGPVSKATSRLYLNPPAGQEDYYSPIEATAIRAIDATGIPLSALQEDTSDRIF